jgi:hypothetical protein
MAISFELTKAALRLDLGSMKAGFPLRDIRDHLFTAVSLNEKYSIEERPEPSVENPQKTNRP